MGSALIRGRYVVTGVAGGRATVIEDGAVFQRDGVVVDVGPAAALAHHAADVALGSPDHVVLPGFVNSHHHVGLTPFQLGSPDLPLELLVRQPPGHARRRSIPRHAVPPRTSMGLSRRSTRSCTAGGPRTWTR